MKFNIKEMKFQAIFLGCVAALLAIIITVSYFIGRTPTVEPEADIPAQSTQNTPQSGGNPNNQQNPTPGTNNNASNQENNSENNSAQAPTDSNNENASNEDLKKEEEHTHSWNLTTTEPTCTESGYTLKSCECGETEKINEKVALGHKMGEWKTETEPTTTSTGLKVRSCERCENYIEEAVIEKLEEQQPDIEQPEQEQPELEQPEIEPEQPEIEPEQPEQEESGEDAATQVANYINEQRRRIGLSKLQYFSAGQSAANTRVQEIATNYSSTRPNGEDYSTVLDGINCSWTGENIAMNYSSAEDVVAGWMNSATYKANILNGNATHIIVGANGTNWVVLFLGLN